MAAVFMIISFAIAVVYAFAKYDDDLTQAENDLGINRRNKW